MSLSLWSCLIVDMKWKKSEIGQKFKLLICLKFPSWEGRWMGDYAIHVVAAILRMLCDLCTLPICSNVMLDEYPVRTRLVNYYIQAQHSLSSRCSNFNVFWGKFYVEIYSKNIRYGEIVASKQSYVDNWWPDNWGWTVFVQFKVGVTFRILYQHSLYCSYQPCALRAFRVVFCNLFLIFILRLFLKLLCREERPRHAWM